MIFRKKKKKEDKSDEVEKVESKEKKKKKVHTKRRWIIRILIGIPSTIISNQYSGNWIICINIC